MNERSEPSKNESQLQTLLGFCERWIEKGATEAAFELDGMRVKIVMPERQTMAVPFDEFDSITENLGDDLDPEQAEVLRKARNKKRESLMYHSST